MDFLTTGALSVVQCDPKRMETPCGPSDAPDDRPSETTTSTAAQLASNSCASRRTIYALAALSAGP